MYNVKCILIKFEGLKKGLKLLFSNKVMRLVEKGKKS